LGGEATPRSTTLEGEFKRMGKGISPAERIWSIVTFLQQ
jgi:hypothetical protein